MKKLFLLLIAIISLSEVYSQALLTGSIVEKSTNEPLVGASVHIKGTTNGTITDIDGNFQLKANEDNGTVVFSFVSFQNQEIAFSGDSNLKVEMETAMVGLDELVVIGYGSVHKDDLSTAVGSVEGIEQMKSRPVSTAGLLQGALPGVNVMNQGGDPGATPNIVIRGLGSPSDKVLWVVDGVPGAPVNSEDIETISVLKDAASAAIYGSSVGSGGVIVVTTKQAKQGKVKVDANFITGTQTAYNTPEALNAAEFNRIKNLAADNAGLGRNDAFDASKNPDGAITRTNWMDEIFRTGKVSRLGVSISGGSDKIKALASVQANNEEGVLLNTFAKSVSGRINVDFKLSDKIKFSQLMQAGTSRGYSNDTYSGYTGAIISAIYMPPSASVYNQDGTFGGVVSPDNLGYAGAYGDIVNPVATLKRKDVYNPNYYVRSTSTLDVEILQGLSFKSMFTVAAEQKLNESFEPKRLEPGKPREENSKSMSSNFNNNWLSENTITYKKALGNHRFTLLGGYSASYAKYKGFGLTAYGFDSEAETARHLVNASDWNKSKPYENMSELSSTSLYSRLSYSYDNRYFLTGSIRKDATSKLYSDNNDDVFKAMSAAWKVSSEDFFNVDFISMLKLRASWGEVGNVNSVPNYSYVSGLEATRGTVLGETPVTLSGLGLESIPNLALTWETSEQMDIGLDINLFNNKLNIVSDYYVKYTQDFIDPLPNPSTFGATIASMGNVGKVKNSGFELAISYGDTSNDFTYRIGANMASNTNSIEDLGSRDKYPVDASVRQVLRPIYNAKDEPWHSFYLIKSDGIFQSDAEAAAHVDKDGNRIQPNAVAGDLKFIDKNEDGIINDEDRQYMGSATPTFTYGINAYFEYKGFDLSMLWQGASGNKIFNAFKSVALTASEQGYNMSKDILGAWSETNKGSDIPRISATDPNKNFQTNSDWFLEDGSYLRLKNLTVGYTLPRNLLSKINAQNLKLRFYASGENLLTFTDYSGMDPEVANYGIDAGKYPVARKYTIGVNVNF